MASIAAIIHVNNDALRLGRALETLRSCHELIVVDHGSTDATSRIGREYGALWVPKTALADTLHHSACDWILCLEACESISENLEASLYEFRLQAPDQQAISLTVQQETADGWTLNPEPQVRLVPKNWPNWNGHWPSLPPRVDPSDTPRIEGNLLRFIRP